MKAGTFVLAPIPQLQMGSNKISLLPDLITSYGKRALLVIGGASLRKSQAYPKLIDQLSAHHISCQEFIVSHEPSPETIDTAINQQVANRPDVVVGIGGGSVLDTAKAISAMLPLNEPVKLYLEGVGTKSHPGVKVPFIAVPTTSGTGSETTRNAVLSEVGEQGYKRSLRHMNFVSNVTILDPLLMISCPPSVTASSGNDAFTQLLESLLSTAATPLSDALAFEGLRHVATSLPVAFKSPENVDARTGMALAAYLSGITLTNVGLGLVHGLAAIIGGYTNIPHGVVCSTLMPAANRITLRRLRQKATWHPALVKYSETGKIFAGPTGKSDDFYADFIIDTIYKWNSDMKIPKLSDYNIKIEDIRKFAALGENKNNPVPLSQEEILEVLEMSL